MVHFKHILHAYILINSLLSMQLGALTGGPGLPQEIPPLFIPDSVWASTSSDTPQAVPANL